MENGVSYTPYYGLTNLLCLLEDSDDVESSYLGCVAVRVPSPQQLSKESWILGDILQAVRNPVINNQLFPG